MDANTRAISIFASYLLINFSLILLITRDIWKVLHHARDAVKSSAARSRTFGIRSHSMLALICLGVTWYYMISFFSLSYKSWAYDNHVDLPTGVHHVVEDRSTIKLGQWLKDVRLFRDAWEVVVETPGRLAWSQPIFFITAGWSFFIALQARSKNIAHAWAYMVLGQLVAISFAMNLFFIAVCAYAFSETASQKHIESADKMVKSRSRVSEGLWTPPVVLYSMITITTVASVLAVPGATGTPYFLHTLAISHVLLLLPPIICKVLPKFLRVYHDRAGFDSVHWLQVYAIFLVFGATQSYTWWQASHDMTPENHLHRHSNVYVRPALVMQNRLPALFSSLLDHPAVSSVGWDSILCTISTVVWMSHA